MIDPTQPATQAQQPGAAPALPVVCIAAQKDGTFMVYPQDQGADAGQPAQDADEAAQLAVSMLSGDAGAEPGADSGTAEDADALFQSGFAGVRGK